MFQDLNQVLQSILKIMNVGSNIKQYYDSMIFVYYYDIHNYIFCESTPLVFSYYSLLLLIDTHQGHFRLRPIALSIKLRNESTDLTNFSMSLLQIFDFGPTGF